MRADLNFTPGEWVLLIGLLSHAVAVFFALWITRRHTVADIKRIAHEVHAEVEKIEAVRFELEEEAYIEGVLEGRKLEREGKPPP